MMKVGDLVKVRKMFSTWATSREDTGIVVSINSGFYDKNHNYKTPVDQLIILWDHGNISSEPATYVEAM